MTKKKEPELRECVADNHYHTGSPLDRDIRNVTKDCPHRRQPDRREEKCLDCGYKLDKRFCWKCHEMKPTAPAYETACEACKAGVCSNGDHKNITDLQAKLAEKGENA